VTDKELLSRQAIRCPDCGLVSVYPDAYDGKRPVSGLCPSCNERLYFDDADINEEDSEDD